MNCYPWRRKQNCRHSLREKKKTTQQLRIPNSFLVVGGNFAPPPILHAGILSSLNFYRCCTREGKDLTWMTCMKSKKLKIQKDIPFVLLLLTFWLVISVWQDTGRFLESDRRSSWLHFKHLSLLSLWFGIFFLLTSYLLLSSFIFTYIKSDHKQGVDRGNRIMAQLPSACLPCTLIGSICNFQKYKTK